MKTAFQSKDVQRVIGRKKQRVEYLSRQLRIIPEVAEVQGTGYVHLYSFRNLLQFAVAESMSAAGLTVEHVRKLLDRFNLIETIPFEAAKPRKEYDWTKYFHDRRNYYDPAESGPFFCIAYAERDGSKDLMVIEDQPDGLLEFMHDRAVEVMAIINLGAIKARVLAYAAGA
jgi:hypothetical protein